MENSCKCGGECQCMTPQEVFESKEFKALKWHQRVWLRLKVAFYETISMH